MSKWSGVKWVADFRDPWTNIHYLNQFHRFILSQKIDLRLERSVLKLANLITSVSRIDIDEDYYPKVPIKDKYYYIPNGYDEDDFKDIPFEQRIINKQDKITIAHIGSIGEERIPKTLYKAIAQLNKINKIIPENFSLIFVGRVEQTNINEYKKYGIQRYVQRVEYIPHKEIFKYFKKASALLLLTYKTNRNIPGKTFEYLRTGKPIIAFGPEDGEAATVLANTKRGMIIDYDDYEKTYNCLFKLIEDLRDARNPFLGEKKDIEKYERKKLTKNLVEVFNLL